MVEVFHYREGLTLVTSESAIISDVPVAKESIQFYQGLNAKTMTCIINQCIKPRSLEKENLRIYRYMRGLLRELLYITMETEKSHKKSASWPTRKSSSTTQVEFKEL